MVETDQDSEKRDLTGQRKGSPPPEPETLNERVTLPRPGALKVDGRRGHSRKKWVADLIDHESRTWNEAIVRECVWPHDANTILNIKLPSRATEDFIAWSGESNRAFSVRSEYRIGMQDSWQRLSQGQL
jgi:hypothetical protein